MKKNNVAVRFFFWHIWSAVCVFGHQIVEPQTLSPDLVRKLYTYKSHYNRFSSIFATWSSFGLRISSDLGGDVACLSAWSLYLVSITSSGDLRVDGAIGCLLELVSAQEGGLEGWNASLTKLKQSLAWGSLVVAVECGRAVQCVCVWEGGPLMYTSNVMLYWAFWLFFLFSLVFAKSVLITCRYFKS